MSTELASPTTGRGAAEQLQLRKAALEALVAARTDARRGTLDRAWQESRDAAALGRMLGDLDIVAGAATAINGPEMVSWSLTASRQALCLEALGMIGDQRPDLREVVSAQLAALANAWTTVSGLPSSVDVSDARRRFVLLQAEHAGSAGAAGLGDRLAAATRLLALGRAAADDEMLAWAHLWRLDAFEELGLRVEFNAELMALGAVVERAGSPVWTWRLAVIRACVALMEDRLDDLPPLVARARSAGRTAAAPDAEFLDLVLRSSIAQRTREGIPGIEAEVREALAAMPFLAQGWRGLLLLDLSRVEEATAIWRAIAPHIEEVPEGSIEWLLATTGHATLAIAAEDRHAAKVLVTMLEPYAHQHVSVSALSPYGGPVALPLGRLAAFLGDRERAGVWLADARRRGEAMNAPAYARATAAAETEIAPRGLGPLSPRESEVAHAVAAGRTNREIADEFFLSERTVEQHVRSILRKLDAPNRAAVATWVARSATR